MILLECKIKNLCISAPEHRSKMRIALLDRAQKTIFSMIFLISCCSTTKPVKILTSLTSRNWLSDFPSEKDEEDQLIKHQAIKGLPYDFLYRL